MAMLKESMMAMLKESKGSVPAMKESKGSESKGSVPAIGQLQRVLQRIDASHLQPSSSSPGRKRPAMRAFCR